MDAGDGDLRALIERARARDPDAWEHLYRRSYARLLSYALRRLPSRHSAEDAVSETMMRAVDGIGRFAWRGAGFDAWLYGILRNVVLEMGRASGRVVGTDLPEGPSPHPGPLEVTMRNEEDEEVRRAFRQLSEHDREILELRVVGELDAESTGALVGMRSGAVRTAQYRALGRLRVLLDEAR